MPLNPDADIEITAFAWVPEVAQGLVKDLRVRWGLEEAGIDYRVRLIGFERPDGYLLEQPFNQVPCLRDDTVQLFESGAILQYIGEKTQVLLPSDKRSRFRAIQWTYAAVNSVEQFVQQRTLLNSFYANEEWAKLAKPTLDRLARTRLEQVMGWLGDKEWLEPDGFTIGDLMMVTVLRIADRGGLLADFPTLAAYVQRGQTRPAFQRALSDQLATFREHQPEGVAA